MAITSPIEVNDYAYNKHVSETSKPEGPHLISIVNMMYPVYHSNMNSFQMGRSNMGRSI